MKTVPMSIEQCEQYAREVEGRQSNTATLDEPPHAAPTHIYLQKFAVCYEYPVVFTRDLFSPVNRLFVETLTRLETNCRHKVMVFIDDGLAACENLPVRVSAYATAH